MEPCFDFDVGPEPIVLPDGRIVVSRMRDLHAQIDKGLRLRAHDGAAAGALFGNLRYMPPPAFLSACQAIDPFSNEFEAMQLALYAEVAGRRYEQADEGHETDSAEMGPPAFPMPFYTNPAEAGYWTLVYGHLLHRLQAARGMRILEIGYGQGGLTELLVRSGLDVTAVEVRESNAHFLKRRVQALGLQVDALTGDVSKVGLRGVYDRIVFFESFHHMPHFNRTLEMLLGHLAPSGSVCFGAEPIVNDDDTILPYPWGLRLDGGALGAARDVGWIEVGFGRSFFDTMLRSLGLTPQEFRLPGYHHSHVVIASRG